MQKHEFGSAGWIGVAREYLLQSIDSTRLGGTVLSFSEEFTEPPAHLLAPGEKTIGWYVQVGKGQVVVEPGLLAHADLKITADYQTMLPMARLVFADDAAATAEAEKIEASATAAGKMRRDGNDAIFANEPALSGAFANLHDTLARRTL